MTDDLLTRLRLIGERDYQCTACYKLLDIADEAADRIEKLEKLLEMRDIFIVKHGLWHEFVDSLELKDD